MDTPDNEGKVRKTNSKTALEKSRQLTPLGANHKDGARKETVRASQQRLLRPPSQPSWPKLYQLGGEEWKKQGHSKPVVNGTHAPSVILALTD